VIGSGLTKPAPATHQRDFRAIIDCGAVVSPLRCSQTAAPWTFPYRNPWIAGLCDTLLVVQAGLKSGALQTARAALAQDVDVWVVPGRMDHPLHQGCHILVSEGARLMTDERSWVGPEDSERRGAQGPPTAEPPEGAELWKLLSAEPVALDELCRLTGRDVPSLTTDITTLELSGWLRRGPAGGFMRAWPERD
jgi:DNA processing protein